MQHKILIVEDEKIIAKDLELRLVRMNYEVVASVSTGKEALAIVREQKVDLILMDIMIDGDIDGIETAKLIHQQMDIPVIFLTAYADEKTFERASSSGPFGYILKPFQERDLDLTIRIVLQKFQLEQQIKSSEIRYRSLFEQSQDAIIIFDNGGRILDANKAASEIYSLNPEKQGQYQIRDLVQPRERAELQVYFEEFLSKGEIKGRYRFIDKYLSIKYIEYQAKANYLPGNHLAVIRDITQSVQDQRQIENLAKFPSEAPHPILRISTSGEIMYANKAANIFLSEWRPKYENSIPNNLKERLSLLNAIEPTMTLSLNIKNRYYLVLFVYVAKGDYINLYGTDITQQKQSERLINHQKDILELIAKGENLQNVLERICAKIQQFIPECLAAIHIYDSLTHSLNFAAGPRLPLNFIAGFQRIPVGKNNTTTGAVAYNKDLIVVENMDQDPSWKDRLQEIKTAGLVSCWGLPVLGQEDEILAVITVFYQHHHKPSTTEITLVNMSCKLIGIAVEKEASYQSLTKHSLAFENIADAVVLTDMEGRITEWSPSAERIFQLPKGDILGKKFQEAPFLSDGQQIEKSIESYFGQSESNNLRYSKEIDFINKNGPGGIAELNVVKLKDTSGNVQGTLHVFSDITEKKKVEQALRTSESYLKAIFDNTIQSFVLLDLKFKILAFNKEAFDFIAEITGKKLAAGELLTDFWFENDVEHFVSVSSRSMSGEYVKFEEKIEDYKGTPIWLEINFQPVYDDDNRLTSICFTALDISERKNAELDLASSEARFRSLVQNSSDMVTVLNENGQIGYTSESTHRMLGYNSEALVGKPLEDLIVSEEKAGFESFLSEVMAKPHETRTFEYTLRNAAGDLMVMQSVFNNLLDVTEIHGVVVNSRDITQKKAAETELKKTNFELDSFVYRASHDLRAPLRSVLGLLNLIKIEPEEKARINYLGLAEKSINKLDSFILDLTNFSRNTRLEIKYEKIDFQALIAECIDNLKYMENAGRVKPIIEINEQESFFSDPGRMAILFQNLISNAVKYQKLYVDSYVKISIEVNEEGARIQVADNGKGISAEYLDRIFEMFFRASEDSYGSGLGLYITRQVVDKLQGKIEVESVYSEGTTFSVWLPHAPRKPEADPPNSAQTWS